MNIMDLKSCEISEGVIFQGHSEEAVFHQDHNNQAHHIYSTQKIISITWSGKYNSKFIYLVK